MFWLIYWYFLGSLFSVYLDYNFHHSSKRIFLSEKVYKFKWIKSNNFVFQPRKYIDTCVSFLKRRLLRVWSACKSWFILP